MFLIKWCSLTSGNNSPGEHGVNFVINNARQDRKGNISMSYVDCGRRQMKSNSEITQSSSVIINRPTCWPECNYSLPQNHHRHSGLLGRSSIGGTFRVLKQEANELERTGTEEMFPGQDGSLKALDDNSVVLALRLVHVPSFIRQRCRSSGYCAACSVAK